MAKLFLSYSRKDEAKARRFTEWLERDGHDVWRDEDDIGGGASFSQEIEDALKDSAAVLVLWSADSVRSAWVRDEAGYGRDAGKLIPFSLDGTEPPLGFRQFQSINLSRWKGHRNPQDAERIRRAIARVAGGPRVENANVARAPKRLHEKLLAKPLLLGGAFAILVALLLGAILWQRWSSNQGIAIAVLPAPQSPNRAMATDYANAAAADLASYLPRRFDGATIIGPDNANGGASAYRMLISADPHGPAVNATLTLTDRDGSATLWSQNWSVPDATASDLKSTVSAAASTAARCLTDALGGPERLKQPALNLYLSGCTGLGDTKLANADFESIFGKVTKLAPNFGPGWSYLALARAWIPEDLKMSSPSAYAAAAKKARDAIEIARQKDPHSTRSYDAEYHLIHKDFVRALEVLNKASEIDPNDGLIQMHLAGELMGVGRLSDAVDAAQRSVELEPGISFVRVQYILVLMYSGQIARAEAALAEARRKWPADPIITSTAFSVNYRYGDPRAALQLLPQVADNDVGQAMMRKVIEARIDPTPAKIDEAIAAFSASSPNDPNARGALLAVLAKFGRTDEAYQLLGTPNASAGINKELLFRPDFASIRADPRFMGVAARLGLVRYWRQTGNWPDFCTTEKLRYDCKTEAAKYQ